VALFRGPTAIGASSIAAGMSFYVTTPIYYVNAEPHLGHAYTTIAADVLARHMRQRGEDVFFLTGTDEHGEPVTQAAERLGVTPRELGDRNVVHFKQLAERVNATTDFFIRTTDREHAAVVQEVVQRIYDNGHVYAGTYTGWYCPRCADFKSESEVEDGNRCPIHRIELDWEEEDNYFFRLSAFQEPLERLYAERPEIVGPESRHNEALSFIRQGLRDVSLSRARLKWGVPVPWDSDQVIYVWIEALLNYYSALAYGRAPEDLTERFWPATVHVIGKDILKFHAVIWPAMLMAAGIEVPRRVYAHGFLLMGEHKMSKSLGNVIDPFQVIDLYGADALRFYVIREVVFGSDGSVSPESFETRYTTELANEYGNLASRTLAMVVRYRDGRVPDAAVPAELVADFDGLAERVRERFDVVDLSGALDEIWQRVRRLNQWIQEQAPWRLAKDPGAANSLDAILRGLVEGLRTISILLHPYMPEATDRLLTAIDARERGIDSARLGAGAPPTVSELEPLFPRVEREARPAA
jgi:methionyl-tRNA synthetase